MTPARSRGLTLLVALVLAGAASVLVPLGTGLGCAAAFALRTYTDSPSHVAPWAILAASVLVPVASFAALSAVLLRVSGSRLLVGVLVAGIVLYAGVQTAWLLRRWPAQRPFDAAVWKAVQLYGPDDTRYRMHRDLLTRHRLIGMTRSEVTALLGPQSDPAYFGGWDVRYWLGPQPYYLDSSWLLLRLRDGRVAAYAVAAD